MRVKSTASVCLERFVAESGEEQREIAIWILYRPSHPNAPPSCSWPPHLAAEQGIERQLNVLTRDKYCDADSNVWTRRAALPR